MPRISPSTLRRAFLIDRLLPQLLPVCRDVRSAQNELRWLRQHAAAFGDKVLSAEGALTRLVARRACGEPLQYILGSEFFGDLEIKCKPGVLIPRQETAAAVQHLVQRLHGTAEFRVLDLCTGTGCIPLLFHHEFYSNLANLERQLSLCGVDISKRAVRLAEENLEIQQTVNKSAVGPTQCIGDRISFLQADVFDNVSFPEAIRSQATSNFDVLISNPPYISNKGYRHTTARSVRMFEPKLALVPEGRHHMSGCLDGDAFYPRLLDIARDIEAGVLLLEVADMDQAERVASMICSRGIWDTVEIWRDEPGAKGGSTIAIASQAVTIRGLGNGRSVVAYKRGHSCRMLEP